MPTCIHCATPFSASSEQEKFCCRGCEFVYELIQSEGLDRFYDLRSDSTIRPVRSTPFETRDLAWLEELKTKTEDGHVSGDTVESDFSLEGLSCVGCVWLVENIFKRQPGALEAAAHPTTGLLRLEWKAGQTDLEDFAKEIASFGYTLAPRKAGINHSEARQLVSKLGLCAAFAMNGMVFTLPAYLGMPDDFPFAGIFQLVVFLSSTLAMLVGGSYFIKRAWVSLRMRSPHIDLPIALGIIFAFIGSIIGWVMDIEGLLYFDFVATFIFLMLAGRYLQLATIEKNRNRLQRSKPVPEIIHSPDRVEPFTLSEISPGIRIRLDPGQSLPVASTLDSSSADFSLEWINGEAESQTFHPGRQLPAGAIYLGTEPVILTTEETWDDSLLAKLTTSERTQSRIPALEKLLKIYLFAIIGIGITGFFVWLSIAGAAPALQIMISVFVVSCPCALGVALPLADELANARMERSGVFIREPLIWSRLRKIRTIIFDKTGTLTLERPVLLNPETVAGLSSEATFALAHLTRASLHPISRSLLESLGSKGQSILRNSDKITARDIPGMGRIFENGSESWTLGRPGWASENAANQDTHDVELCLGKNIIARFQFEESLRPDAIAATRILAKHHRLVILSGDRQGKVHTAAAALGIEDSDAHFSLTPEQKEDLVRDLDHHDTLYLGDGANDSLAFNAAHATGTPVVDRSLLESKSDFFFLGQSLRFLPMMLDLAKQRSRTVTIAFIFAVIYNLTAIAVALCGYMTPLAAAIVMPLSSVISLAIVASGLRGRR
ncbi:heavy metal translocating P-type ATPase [Luteolibacter sp. AS25]|uniref:heavy metal translocating P-type ATPase n=1 Tax=Luteolibacter sp. AS25 TaxID=3135776 RepID=UPI00398B2CC8